MNTQLPGGLNLREWLCGRVLYQGNPTLGVPPATCGGIVEWIPFVHVRRGGDEDCHAMMGAHAMCVTCRLKFKLADLKNLSMWDSVLSNFKAEGYDMPRDKEIEIEWVSVEDYLKQVQP